MSPADAVGSDLGVDQLCADVHGHLAALRASSPVAYVAAIGGFLVTSHALALAVMRDPETFTVDDPGSRRRGSSVRACCRSTAPHGRHRAAFAPGYRPRQVDERFGPFVAERAGRLVRRLSSPAELRADLAGPLAAAVVAESLGLDGRDDGVVGRLLEWYRCIVDSVATITPAATPRRAGRRRWPSWRWRWPATSRHGDLTPEELLSNAPS